MTIPASVPWCAGHVTDLAAGNAAEPAPDAGNARPPCLDREYRCVGTALPVAHRGEPIELSPGAG